jgi:hypothetical protein
MAATAHCTYATPVTAHSPNGEDLLGTFWSAFDSLDADRVACLFACDGSLCLGDNPPLQGRTAIRRAFVRLFTELDLSHHETVALWSHEGLVVADSDVAFILVSGGKMLLPVTTVLWTIERQIRSCRLLLYPEPALARATSGFAVAGGRPIEPAM